jgi:NADH-quinone oxidoreductase subunit G
MVNIQINGIKYEVDPNLTVIEAAAQNGIEIPHFCWHPKLSVAGNCRMCLVDIEKMPKLAIACSTRVAEGMVVWTANEKAIKARQAVMEMLLINHPLDCPICDEAGECKLQEYAYAHSVGSSRFEEDKVNKPKRVKLGPNVMLDDERCIMCSRCIRYANEIVNQPVLTFTNRGNKTVLTVFPGTEFDNPYSMNVVELCPVGALTSRDFRFKARVWEMSSTPGVCTGCARGCNIDIWVKQNEILRLTPRMNPDVNGEWMCDNGRLETFKYVKGPNRVNGCYIRKNGKLVECGWDEAIAYVVNEFRMFKKHEIAALGSAYATNEDNYLFQKIVKSALGTSYVDVIRHELEGDEDAFLIRADKTPNALGASEVGVQPENEAFGLKAIIKGIADGSIKALYVMDENIASVPEIAAALPNLQFMAVHSSVMNETTAISNIVLAASTYAERHGTFVNFNGRIQRIRPAVTTIEADRSLDGFAMSRWDKFAAHNDSWGRENKIDARPHWRILSMIGAAYGLKMKYQTAEEVFKELAEKIPAFKGLSYANIGETGTQIPIAESVSIA